MPLSRTSHWPKSC